MSRLGLTLAVVLVVLFCTGPFLWQVLTSLRPENELTRLEFPSSLTLESYRSVLGGRPFARSVLNSFLVASATTVTSLFFGATAAFALTRLELRGRRFFLGMALLASMFPGVAVVSPLYLTVRALGLRDHLLGLVLPYTTFALPMAVWILSGFFRAIPDEIYRAAIIDGCSPFQAFRRIMLPLAAPGLGTTAILVFISSWNEFLYALALTSSARSRTVPVAIGLFAGDHKEPWGEIAAASVIAMLPVILVALFFQRWIAAGLTTSAAKR